MVDGGEGGEEHVDTAAPVICLSRRAFNYEGWVMGVKKGGSGEVRVELYSCRVLCMQFIVGKYV